MKNMQTVNQETFTKEERDLLKNKDFIFIMDIVFSCSQDLVEPARNHVHPLLVREEAHGQHRAHGRRNSLHSSINDRGPTHSSSFPPTNHAPDPAQPARPPIYVHLDPSSTEMDMSPLHDPHACTCRKRKETNKWFYFKHVSDMAWSRSESYVHITRSQIKGIIHFKFYIYFYSCRDLGCIPHGYDRHTMGLQVTPCMHVLTYSQGRTPRVVSYRYSGQPISTH